MRDYAAIKDWTLFAGEADPNLEKVSDYFKL
jgi:hypothetical protein